MHIFRYWKSSLPVLLIVAVATSIALFRVSSSGEQWLEDGPRYLNNAAMIHDFLVSGEYLDPVGFAKQNYRQYPAHNVPYHPPGYAFILAVWFHLFGMSYVSARCFIACCTAGFGIAMYDILRLQGVHKTTSSLTACVLLSFPEIALWSRTGMSELPALMFITCATCIFLRSLKRQSSKILWFAYAIAICAFFCRISSAGILPCWGVAILLSGRQTIRFWTQYLAASFLYIGIGIGWVKFASRYSQHEMRQSVSDSLLSLFNAENLLVWWTKLPDSIGWASVATSLIACLLLLASKRKVKLSILFWISWIMGCFLLVAGMGFPHEHRYFIFALPGIAGLCQITSSQIGERFSKTSLTNTLLILVVAVNVPSIQQIDYGLVGFQKVADSLAMFEDEGNVLLASHIGDSDIIFRYRAHEDKKDRQFLRSDRTLHIRLADYYRAINPTDPLVLADTEEAGLDIIRRGRVRYLVTWEYGDKSENERRHADVLFAKTLAESNHFSLMEQHTITRRQKNNTVNIWRYNGPLLNGTSELDLVIPTANLVLRPADFE